MRKFQNLQSQILKLKMYFQRQFCKFNQSKNTLRLNQIKKERKICFKNDQLFLIKSNKNLLLDSISIQTTIGMTLPNYLDGLFEEWRKAYDQRMTELEQKLESNQIIEEDFATQKRTDYSDLPEGYQETNTNFNRLAFSSAHDQYYQVNSNRFEMVILLLGRDGSFEIHNKETLKSKPYGKIIKQKQFQLNLKQTDDEAILLRLQDLDSEIENIVFGLTLQNLQNNIKQLEWMQNASFGLYDAQYCIPFLQFNISKAFKIEQLVKTIDDPELSESPQTVFFSCFTLSKRFKQFGGWFIENTIGSTKDLIQCEIQPFYTKLAQFLLEMHEFNLERDHDIKLIDSQLLLNQKFLKQKHLTNQVIQHLQHEDNLMNLLIFLKAMFIVRYQNLQFWIQKMISRNRIINN